MARIVSFLVLIGILVVIAVIFFRVMAGFFVPLFLAALLGVVVQPLYRWMLSKCRGYRYLAATITTTLVTLIVLLPIGLIVTTATLEGLSLLDQMQLSNVRTKLDQLRDEFGLRIPREQDVRRIEAVLRTWREKQRQGESLDFKADEVKGLIVRVDNIEKWLNAQRRQGLEVPSADASALKDALTQLLGSEDGPANPDNALPPIPLSVDENAIEKESVRQEDALLEADAEFREFKRNLLGGTYRAWLTEWANPSDEQIEQIRSTAFSTAGPVLSFGTDTLLLIVKLAAGTLIMVVALFFLLAEGSRMLQALVKLSPLEEKYVRELVTEFDRACRAIVTATLLSAVVQGLLAGVGFYFCGLRSSVALLTVLTMVLALVPFTGAAAVWIPVSLYLYFYQGSLWAAVGLAIYGAIVISGADNVIKPLVLHGQSNLHPLLALLSVIGGIQALGPIGILVGPMVVVFLQVLLRLLQRELSSLDRSSLTFWRGFGTAGVPPGTPAALTAADLKAAAGAPPPTGNGKDSSPSLAKQPQQQGKKRKK
jgi:predicted PurR-regulated permease PerM